VLKRLYAKWMMQWEWALTTRDTNRIVRPVEWGWEWLADCGGVEAEARVNRGEATPLAAMAALNAALVAAPETFFRRLTPTDFRLEMRHPELFPTNVREETLEQEREYQRQAAAGELRKAPFLRFTSTVRTPHAENDVVNARWYEVKQGSSTTDAGPGKAKPKPKQAIIVMPQWNADAFSHNAVCEMFNWFGVSALRLSKPYHDIRRPAELERSDYAVSSNVGRTLSSARQAVADIRACVDWLQSQGYEQFGVLGTSLGSCYGYLAAAMDPRLQVCAFNHVSTSFGDVIWEGQSTRHVTEAFRAAGLTQDQVRSLFTSISPASFVERFAAQKQRHVLMIYAPWDLTFPRHLSLEAIDDQRRHGLQPEVRVLPCGHYTTGETPFKYIDGWYMGSFVRRAFRAMAAQHHAAD
jgi:hypothetical protein